MSSLYGTIVGRVLEAAGAPVGGATVAAIRSSQPHRDITAITSHDGSFVFSSMVPGRYRLEARAGGVARTADVTVAAGARAGVEIVLTDSPPDILVAGDERRRVTNYQHYPWRCVCSLLITAANGSSRIGTGWLAAPRLVITAGHCIHTAEGGGWAAKVEVIPGRNGAERPFGSALAEPRDLRCVSDWTVNADHDYDYGAILLPPESLLGANLGSFGYAPREDTEVWGATLNLAGYPADGGGRFAEGTQWYATGGALAMSPRHVTYAIGAAEGQEGSPVWLMTEQGDRYCVAIHTGSNGGGPRGTRVNQQVFDTIARWSAEVS